MKMTATLTFNLPEETYEHQTAIDAYKWRMIVDDIRQNIRQDLKYNVDKLSPEEQKTLENMRTFIYRRLEEENLSLD